MAACIVDNCRLCHEILPLKHRRTIFTDTFKVIDQLSQVIGYVPRINDGLSKHVCGYCFTKLNKISKLDFDIIHRVEALRNERTELIKLLREKYLQSLNKENIGKRKTPEKLLQTSIPAPTTPINTQPSKRSIDHSPTPRKGKKALLFAPPKESQRLILPKTQRYEEPKPGIKRKISVALFSPTKVKVLFRPSKSEKIKSRFVKPGLYRQIVTNISRDSSKDKISKLIFKSDLKESLNKCFMTELKKQSTVMCARKNPSLLRECSSRNMTTFSIDRLNSDIKDKAPLFYGAMSTIVNGSILGTVVTSAVALKFRNVQLSALHHILGHILDRGGATDEEKQLKIHVAPLPSAKEKKIPRILKY